MSITMIYGKNRTGDGSFADNFAQVSGETSSSNGWSEFYDYPEGFTSENCSIVSVELYSEGNGWRGGVGTFSGTIGRVFAELNVNGVRVYRNEANTGGVNFRVTLMRIR